MTGDLAWVHVGNLHLEEADGRTSLTHLTRIVEEVNAHIGTQADVLFLPGDNANHGEAEQYRESRAIPKRRLPVAPGCDCHAIGAWPIAGIESNQLGPNKNGRAW